MMQDDRFLDKPGKPHVFHGDIHWAAHPASSDDQVIESLRSRRNSHNHRDRRYLTRRPLDELLDDRCCFGLFFALRHPAMGLVDNDEEFSRLCINRVPYALPDIVSALVAARDQALILAELLNI